MMVADTMPDRKAILIGLAAVVCAVAAIGLTAPIFAFSATGAIALYFVVWWTILFAVLPFGVRSQAEEGVIVPGSEAGAPARPQLLNKALWTTGLACFVYAGAASAVRLLLD